MAGGCKDAVLYGPLLKSDGPQSNAALRNAMRLHLGLRDNTPAADPHFYLRRSAPDAGVFEEATETRGFRVQKFVELIRVHVEGFDPLLGEGIAHLRQRQNFGDLLIKARDDGGRRAAGGQDTDPAVELQREHSG